MGDLPFEKIKRELLIKRDVKPGPFGEDPNNRPMEVLLDSSVTTIDKPKGPTSHQVSAYAAQILGASKSGHSGTLDPKVTGVLSIAIGRGTRIVQALQTAGKEYICLLHLHKKFPKEEVERAVLSFVGKIKQLPPVKSAVKRQWRFRKIYYIDILEIDGQDVLFKVGCQAGTYIRKLCHDIGGKLETGGHMAELRRSKAGPYNETRKIFTLQDLTDAVTIYKKEGNETFLREILEPLETGVAHLPKVYVLDSSVDAICHGANLAVPGIAKIESDIQEDEMIAIMTLKKELIALGKTKMISNDMLKKERGVAAVLEAVFMKPGTYPKMKKK